MRSEDFDERLKEHAEILLAIGIPTQFIPCLATSIRDEILSLDMNLLRIDTPTLKSVGFLSNVCARNRYVNTQRVCPTQNV